MRKFGSPDYGREDCLDTVFEVPFPEEMFLSGSPKNCSRSWRNVKSWMRPQGERSGSCTATNLFSGRSSELQILLGVVGAPLVPLPVPRDQSINPDINDHSTERSMAKYIVQQYIAATGGEGALNSVESMYAMGKVRMVASEFTSGDDCNKKDAVKVKRMRHQGGGVGEVGSFVLWQKRPDLWCLDLVLSGCKIGAGSDGMVAWRQTPWHHSHASRGPPRPLRRSLQGLDPRATASLFSHSVCMGEKAINDEDCFLLKLEAEISSLKARSSNKVEIIRHTIWGYFSQKTGLLIKLEDSHLLRITTAGDDNIYWETTMESYIQDYRTIDGINIAHGGRTYVSLFRFGDSTDTHSRTRMEEVWTIEEVDFNMKGLSNDFFLPPSDLKKDQEGCNPVTSYTHPPSRPRVASVKIVSSKVAAVDDEESCRTRVASHKIGSSKVSSVEVEEWFRNRVDYKISNSKVVAIDVEESYSTDSTDKSL